MICKGCTFLQLLQSFLKFFLVLDCTTKVLKLVMFSGKSICKVCKNDLYILIFIKRCLKIGDIPDICKDMHYVQLKQTPNNTEGIKLLSLTCTVCSPDINNAQFTKREVCYFCVCVL